MRDTQVHGAPCPLAQPEEPCAPGGPGVGRGLCRGRRLRQTTREQHLASDSPHPGAGGPAGWGWGGPVAGTGEEHRDAGFPSALCPDPPPLGRTTLGRRGTGACSGLGFKVPGASSCIPTSALQMEDDSRAESELGAPGPSQPQLSSSLLEAESQSWGLTQQQRPQNKSVGPWMVLAQPVSRPPQISGLAPFRNTPGAG